MVLALLTRRALSVEDSGFYASFNDLFEQPGFAYPVRRSLALNMNQYMVPYLAWNPHYRPALAALFGEDLDIFAPIARLLRPVRALRDMRDRFMEEHFAGHRVAGMQCGEDGLPHDGRPLRYFIATDTEKGREVAESSFGYMAAGLRGRAGNRIVTDVIPGGGKPAPRSREQFYMGVPHKSDRRVACKELPTHQPCFHKFANWGARDASCFRSRLGAARGCPRMVEKEMLGRRPASHCKGGRIRGGWGS
eukprot:gene38142-20336_t